MSYARWTKDSDVYVWGDVSGRFCCGWCSLDNENAANAWFSTRSEVLDHLHAHQAAGHDVPPKAFALLRAERAAEGETLAPLEVSP